jgi:hypothetical protein
VEIVEDERLADDKDAGDAARNQGQSKLVQNILIRQAEQEAASKGNNKDAKQQQVSRLPPYCI